MSETEPSTTATFSDPPPSSSPSPSLGNAAQPDLELSFIAESSTAKASVSSQLSQLSYGLFDTKFKQATCANPKLRYGLLHKELEKQWEKFVVVRRRKLVRQSSKTNELVGHWAKQSEAEEIKLASMEWHRPAHMDHWEQNKDVYEHASIPSGPEYWFCRPKPQQHALPESVRGSIRATSASRKRPGSGKQRPDSAKASLRKPAVPKAKNRPSSAVASTRPPLTSNNSNNNNNNNNNNASKKQRPLSAHAKIPSPQKVVLLPPSPRAAQPTAEELLVPPDQLLDALFSAMSRFSSALAMNSLTTRKFLLEALSSAIAAVNAVSEEIARKHGDDVVDAAFQASLVASQTSAAQTRVQTAAPFKSKFREPLHMGKPAAYMSPVLKHRQAKQAKLLEEQAKLQKLSKSKKKLRPASASSGAGPADLAILKALGDLAREKRHNRNRPWSAPSNKVREPTRTKPVSFTVKLGRWCQNSKECATLLRALNDALTPSFRSPLLPFSLYFDLKRNCVDKCLEEGGKPIASVLRRILVHPGVSGADLRLNKTAPSSATSRPEVDLEEDPELVQAATWAATETSSRRGSAHQLAQSAIFARENMRKLTNSPPLESMLVDEESVERVPVNEQPSEGSGKLWFEDTYDDDFENDQEEEEEKKEEECGWSRGLDLMAQEDGFISEQASEVTACVLKHGYFGEPVMKMKYNRYPGMPGKQVLPSFTELMTSLDLNERGEGGGERQGRERVADGLDQDELEELRVTRRNKNFIFKGDYNIRQSFRA
jgi:hypothetical protein